MDISQELIMTTPRSVLDNIRRRYRDWRAARRAAFELQCVGAAEVERVAQELGLSSSALQSLVTHPDERELLAKRLTGLHLKPSALPRETFRDMQRVCSMCGCKYRCGRDLALKPLDSDWQKWREYCPNATTLTALEAVRSGRQFDPAVWE
jgi:hypothetical protein